MIQEVKYSNVRASTVNHQQEWDKLRIRGKFLSAPDSTLWIKGVTYGTFRPFNEREEFSPARVERDFELMRQNAINSVRVYTIPPRWMLDKAQQIGLRLFIGFPWEQHVTFLDERRLARAIRATLKSSLQPIADHPAILCCSIGNEIPSGIVRWHGARKVQNYLRTLYETAKECNPDLLVTYVNYPSTEYLQLPFLDLLSFNVFLESKNHFRSYLQRLQNLAGDKPILISEIGLDSRRNGLERQARLLRSQVWSSFRRGCAGVFVYSWTDEWFRGGEEIEDWDFGLTTRDRHPKPALETVSKQFAKVPFRNIGPWPQISVVVCSYNGSKTIDQCLTSLMRLDYENYEVVVIDDGSTDSTADIVSKYPVRLIRTPNRGLSAARNLGMQEARGEIIAYIDDDAYADRQWLHYLATAFQETSYACFGGPNVVPPEDPFIAQCVARSPGGPIHVLLTDEEAEHVPGCNLSVRKAAMEQIGGFDPQFRTAGDDVDFCWRLQHSGFRIGYHPAAIVWHHRRNSFRSYFRQQRGYGKAESILARKWPDKYNGSGHLSWAGHIYQNETFSSGSIYSGIWGSAPFQSLYERPVTSAAAWIQMPEWIIVILIFGFLAGLGLMWHPLKYMAILSATALFAFMVNGFRSAWHAVQSASGSFKKRLKLFITTTFLYCAQPIARLIGRFPLWRPSYQRFQFPFPRTISIWSEVWQDPTEKLSALLSRCTYAGAIITHGQNFDQWDLEAKGGAFGSARLIIGVEEHGHGKQLTRFHIYPRILPIWIALVCLLMTLSISAALDSAWIVSGILATICALLGIRILKECGTALSALVKGIESAKSV